MSNRIEIDFTRSEGAVLRLIGLVERKGFDVCSVDMPETGPGPALPLRSRWSWPRRRQPGRASARGASTAGGCW